MQTVELVSPYEVRDQFRPLHARKTRWFIGVAHRRAGKTVSAINELIMGALKCKLPNPRFAYVAPQLNQAKDIAWTYLKEYTAFLSPRINESELWVELPGGARIRIYGADNPDRLRGIYLDGVVPDEFGDMDPTVWTQVLRPALSDRKGWACFIGTPKGKNTFHRLWTEAEGDEYSALLVTMCLQVCDVPRETLDRFFAKVHTPVQPTPELEAAALAAHPAAAAEQPVEDVAKVDPFGLEPLEPVGAKAALAAAQAEVTDPARTKTVTVPNRPPRTYAGLDDLLQAEIGRAHV